MGLSDQLPEDFEGKDKFDRYESVADLAKAYSSLEKKLGSSLPKPTDEQSLDDLLRKLGAPGTPDGYQLPNNVDPNSIGQLQQWAAEANLTPEQFARVAEKMHAEKAEAFEQRTSQQSAVQKEFGESFHEAQARVVRALEGMEESERALYNPEDPAHFRLLERLGRGAAEQRPAGIAPTGQSGAPPNFDPNAVAEEARRILESPAYRDRFHEEHNTARQEYGKRAEKLFMAGFQGAYDERLMPKATPWSK